MRKKWRLNPIFISLCVGLGFATEAWADQCAYVSKEQALAAVSRLQVGQTIYQLCEPCGNRISSPIRIQALSAATTGSQDFWEVKVNGASIDLAYTFINSANAEREFRGSRSQETGEYICTISSTHHSPLTTHFTHYSLPNFSNKSAKITLENKNP